MKQIITKLNFLKYLLDQSLKKLAKTIGRRLWEDQESEEAKSVLQDLEKLVQILKENNNQGNSWFGGISGIWGSLMGNAIEVKKEPKSNYEKMRSLFKESGSYYYAAVKLFGFIL
mmetsp:Transcript_6812/g.7614  ORF Transcript_6812/g.7614 Transcript_6812/m.7614 type:complete len:115 (+) Transcript_6812:331-675(+)